MDVTEAKNSHSRTLFVRNLPYTATNEQLTEIFSEIGPLKSCFVVNDKETSTCKGFGYVKYSDGDDAAKAVAIKAQLGERKLQIKFAERKDDDRGTGKPRNKIKRKLREKIPNPDTETDIKTEAQTTDEGSPAKKRKTGQMPPLNASPQKNKSAASKSAVIKKSKQQKNAKQRDNSKPTFRLIFRNLSFKVDDKILRQKMSDIGEVIDVHIPLKDNGAMKGFGFVSFANKECAQKAIELFNAKKLEGRPVAVDWAMGKSEYQMLQTEQAADPVKKELVDDSSTVSSGSTKKRSAIVEVKTEPEEVREDEEPSEESADETDQSDAEMDETNQSDESFDESDKSDEESGQSDDEMDGMNQSEDEDVEQGDWKGEKSEKKTPKQHETSSADITQERTLFIRNVSYSTTEEDLTATFSEFGKVTYSKVLVDQMTERSKGVAFVQYNTKESADKCLTASEDPDQISKLTLDSRQLNVTLAVSREKIHEMEKNKEKQPKDNRNLYLVREGMIRAGTSAAAGISSSDLAKRAKLELTKREKLKKPTIFVSTTRLSIHNIPARIDDRRLKQIVGKAVGDKEAKITECRIMRDLAHLNEKGKGRSRGFGFVELSEHKHALAVLRNMNNNPDIFQRDKRPIVEFSLENTVALQSKEKRKQMWLAAEEVKQGIQRKDRTKLKPRVNKNDGVERPKGVKPGLPSHMGPKLRHKKRAEPPGSKSKKNKKTNKYPAGMKPVKETQQKKSKSSSKELTDNFDKLVSSYRKKISGAAVGNLKTSKWYQ